MDYLFVRSKKKGKEEYGSIYARVRTHGANTKYVLGFMIRESEWQKYKSLKYVSSATIPSLGIRYGQLSNILMQIKYALEENFDSETATSVIRNIIISVLSNRADRVTFVPQRRDDLLRNFMAKYIEELRNGTRTKRKRSVPVTQGHCNNLRSALVCLEDYEALIQKQHSLNEITMDFQQGFVKYLRDRGLKQNTINVRMSAIHIVMQVAYQEKKTTCVDFQHPEFVPAREEVEEIYLTPDKVEQMISMDLSSKEALQRLIDKAGFGTERLQRLPKLTTSFYHKMRQTRDIFVIGCLTGQRISDYMRISTEMLVALEGKQFLQLKQIKTGKTVMIPYDIRVRNILSQYGGHLPHISRSTFGRHLRLIGELLGWTYSPFADREDRETSKRFFELMTSHTARRSFATNAYAAGIPLSSILAVTGHSTERSLRTYLRLDTREKAIIAASDFKDFIRQ